MKPFVGMQGGSCLEQGPSLEMILENKFHGSCQIDGEIFRIKPGKSRILLNFKTQVHLLKYA